MDADDFVLEVFPSEVSLYRGRRICGWWYTDAELEHNRRKPAEIGIVWSEFSEQERRYRFYVIQ